MLFAIQNCMSCVFGNLKHGSCTHHRHPERLELSVNHFGCTPCNLAPKDGPWGLEALATSHKGILYAEGPQPTTLQ